MTIQYKYSAGKKEMKMINFNIEIKDKLLCVLVFLVVMVLPAYAQDNTSERIPKAQLRRTHASRPSSSGVPDTLLQDSSLGKRESDQMLQQADNITDSISDMNESMAEGGMRDTLAVVDSLLMASTVDLDVNRIKKRFVPDPKTAMWLAIVFPGGGQIYNHKYWKLPIIYGGFLGCAYAMNWNNTMYSDYSQAYIDIMDDDPNTKSYEDFLPIGYDANANKDRLKTLFKRKKDYYRRYRDLSIFCVIGVYALSIIDAYVDAELSSFDISKDLSMRVRPSVINGGSLALRSPYPTQAYGVQCSLEF